LPTKIAALRGGKKNMAHFTGIGVESGYTDMTTSPFFIVPSRGSNILVLLSGHGYRVRPGDSRLGFNELSSKEVGGAVREYVSGLKYLTKDGTEGAYKELWTRCHNMMHIGARIFSIGGKGSGLSYVEASGSKDKLRVDVAILPPKTFKVAFRCLQHPDGNNMKNATEHSPEEAKSIIAKVNAIFVPQVNIAFEAVDSRWTVTQPLNQPISEAGFRAYILKDKSDIADITVFLVGKWKGKDTDPNGTYFKDEKVAVVDDKPSHPEKVKADGFLLTLSHELAHFLQDRRNLVGHHSRDKVLLSTGIQSTLIDKQLVADLNPW
jgi:hypothetical protein